MTQEIALVAINAKSSHSNPVVFLMRRLIQERYGHACTIHELTINMTWKDCLASLTAKNYTHYFFSVYIWNTELVQVLIPMLKKINSEALIIAGGPEAAYSEDFEHIQGLDAIIEGQAESFITQYFTETGIKLKPIEGCAQRIKVSALSIDESPFPYIDEDSAVLKNRLVYYEASRGCSFKCVYCLSSRKDQNPEYRNIEAVKDHFRKLISMAPKTVKMVDRTFNADREFAREIWRFLIDIDSAVSFHFELHPIFLEEEDFVLLSRARPGLFIFEVGIQSTNSMVLKKSGRAGEWEKIQTNLRRLCLMKNIHTHLDQIVGLPGDSIDTAKTSFHDILNLNPDEFQLGFLKVLPGTELKLMCPEYGIDFSTAPPYEVYQTKDFRFNNFKMFYHAEKTVRQFYNSGYFNYTFRYLINKISDCWEFFDELGKNSEAELGIRQWPVLAKKMLAVSLQYFTEDKDYIMDLLRYDWCLFAPSQGYPDFLPADPEIKEKRSSVYSYLKSIMPEVSQQDFYHSILFLPHSKKMLTELGDHLILFLREEGHRKPVKIPIGQLKPESRV